jgi:hypothetical protein
MMSQAQLSLTFLKKKFINVYDLYRLGSSIFYQIEKHIIYISQLLMVVKKISKLDVGKKQES